MIFSEKISVILPVYNCEKTISRCVESVLSQIYQNIELIIIDDCSEDNSYTICEKYANQDSRIKIIRLSKNSGVAYSRNIGLENASGEIIAFIDGDDFIGGEFFDSLHKKMMEYNADIVTSDYTIVNGSKLYRHAQYTEEEFQKKDALKELLFDDKIQNYVWNKLYKRNLFDDICFTTSRYFEDVEIMYKLFYKSDKIVYIPNGDYYYTQNNNSLIHKYTHEKYTYGWDIVMRRYYDLNNSGLPIQEENSFAVAQWFLRFYIFMSLQRDDDDYFLRNQVDFVRQLSDYASNIILHRMNNKNRMILNALLWNYDIGKKIIWQYLPDRKEQ